MKTSKNIIEALEKEFNMSRYKISKSAGVDASILSRIKSGETHNGSMKTHRKLSVFLDSVKKAKAS